MQMSDASDHSYWNDTAALTAFPPLSGGLDVDVAVIGGGIVGITAARVLKDRGLKVAVIEARRVGRQVTGRSTAKMTSQHHLFYQMLIRKFGEDRARLYAEAQEAGVRQIRTFAANFGINCDIETKSAYTYTCDEKYVEQIEREVEAAQRIGLPATLVREVDLPFKVLCAIRFDKQAQFHPTKYIIGLAATLPGDGCHVFENSRAVDWTPTSVVTEQGRIRARHVIMATHIPLGHVGGYYTRAHPYAEPVIGARIRKIPEGMFISAEQPIHSIRTHTQPNGDIYGIAAGSIFKPGHTDDERKYFADIEAWLTGHFECESIEYRWVNEDYASVDHAPFIGWSAGSGDRYLVATGFNAWGISNGTAAGVILADLATGHQNTWMGIFDATRVKLLAEAALFIRENVEVGAHLIGGYLSRKLRDIEEIELGHAAIMKRDGKNIAVFKDEQGAVHAVSAVCTHMGCLVGWNETDRTWDCPCHGSRFSLDGEVLHGPATRPLAQISQVS
jgi:glycine/D-amino acid oxidase-like deaminating enzyme/nitrite reductase/ring-hydroxylating ferredoxin subunit